MSERRIFTLEDVAVSYLNSVPKDLNSKFVSSLILSFFEGKSLLSNSDWSFLSEFVKGREEDLSDVSCLSPSDMIAPEKERLKEDLPDVLSLSPLDKIAQGKERLKLVLDRLSLVDFSSQSSLSEFLSDPEVRVWRFLDMKFSELVSKSGREVRLFDQSIVFYNGWEFMSFIPLHYYMNALSSSVSDVLSDWSNSSFDKYHLPEVVSSLLTLASDVVVSDLEFIRDHGMTRSQYASYIALEKKALEDSKRAQAEEWESKKSDAWASSEREANKRLSGSCFYSSYRNDCSNNLIVGYFVDPSDLKPYFTPVFCWYHHSMLPYGRDFLTLTDNGYKFVSKDR